MERIVVAMLMALLVFPAGIYAQEVSREDTASRQLKTPTAAMQGVISKSVTREAAKLRTSRTELVAQIATGGQQRSWPARHPVWTGFLIGAGVGAVLGGVQNADTGCFDSHVPPCPLGYAALGAGFYGGIGALLGLAF